MNGTGWHRVNLYAGGTIVVAVCALALISLLYMPYDPLNSDFNALLEGPSGTHLLGTDNFGRDLLSRVMHGAQISLATSLFTVALAFIVGVTIGGVAGFSGGAVDRLLMMINDAMMAFPSIILALVLVAVIGPSITGVVLALGFAFAPAVVRVTRGTVLSIKEMQYVEANRVLGGTGSSTLFRHVLPNTASPLTVLATSLFADALLLESALSFLGLGVPPPEATWGGLLADSRQYISEAWWLGLYPGLAISLTLVGINLLGDALRDRLDPRMRDL